MSFRVLVADNLAESGIDVLRRDKERFRVEVRKGIGPDEVLRYIPPCHALLVRSRTRVTAELLDAAPDLRVIGRAGIGVDNIDLAACTRRSVQVLNAPAGSRVTTAEHALAMIFSLARHIPQADASMKAGRWDKRRFVGVELTDKTLGIIGIGAIGSIVAERARGLRMKVIASDPHASPEGVARAGVELVPLDALFERSDFISIHVPLSDATRHLLDERAFELMKDRVRIVNCARGGIIDEAALYEAIVSGKVAGAALDVFSTEPPVDLRLIQMPQVIATPHLGAATFEAQIKVSIAICEQVRDYLVEGTVRNAVNPLPAPR